MNANKQTRRSREDTPEDVTLLSETDQCRRMEFDDMFKVLNHRHRRYAIYHLADRSTADLDALLDYVAALEADRSEPIDQRERIRRLKIEFHHRHLPMLEDVGLVEYDDRNGTVAYLGRSPVFEAILRTTRRNDPVAFE